MATTEALRLLKFGFETSNAAKSSTTQTTKYELLTDNFISVLKKVGDCPFAVYCMSGNARLGKSYTLNFFIRKLRNQEIVDSSQLFKWRKGSDRETVGINLWPEPFFMNDENGRKVGILLMDAQGLFDEHTTLQQNSVIFALSSLFSTVCIFNLLRQIQPDTLQNVDFFTSYACAIGHKKLNKGDADGDPEKLQRLVLMVRDFENDHEFGFGYHDNTTAPLNTEKEPCNYFHKKFSKETSNPNPIPYENMAIVNRIDKNYDNVSVILHPHPGKAFIKDPIKNKPEQEFIEKSEDFVELMLSPGFVVTKKIEGAELSGVEFIPFVEHLGEILKNAGDNFPSAQTIAESAFIMSHTFARTNAYHEFTERITISMKKSGLSEPELDQVYESAEKVALEAFHKIKIMGTKEKEKETLNLLLDKCRAKFESLKQVYVLLQRLEEERKKQEVQGAEFREREAVATEKIKKLEREKMELAIMYSANCSDDMTDPYPRSRGAGRF